MRKLFLFICILISCTIYAQLAVKIGTRAPVIKQPIKLYGSSLNESLQTTDGPVLLHFFDTYSRESIEAISKINSYEQEFKDKITFLSITTSSTNNISNYADRYKLPQNVVIDSLGSISTLFYNQESEIYPIPLIVLIDLNQIIKWIGTPDYLDESILEKLSKGVLKESNSIDDIINQQEWEDELSIDKDLSFIEWYRTIERTKKYHFEFENSDEGEGITIQENGIIASSKISLLDILSTVLDKNQNDINLPRKLASNSYYIIYKNDFPEKSFGDDLMVELAQRLEINITTHVVEKSGFSIKNSNEVKLEQSDGETSYFYQNKKMLHFEGVTINDLIKGLNKNTSLNFFNDTIASRTTYNADIDISNKKKLLQNLKNLGFHVYNDTRNVEVTVIKFKD